MQRLLGGYTVVEVMIFLLVSGVIFAGAVTIFQGQQGKSAFEQGMHDLVSKIQHTTDQVTTSVFAGGQYNCQVSNSTGRASLSTGSNGVGTNQGCIFLGRAIQVIPGQTQLFIYSVLGNQFDSNGNPVTSYAGSLPEPAMSSGADLTEQYDTNWGKPLSSTITYSSGSTASSDLVSFYNSLQDGYQNSGQTDNTSVTARGYNFTSNSLSSVRSSVLQSCLEEQGTCANTPTISSWKVCYQSTGSNQTALLTVNSTPGGINADVNFTSCS